MLKTDMLDDLCHRLSAALPDNLSDIRDDVSKNFKGVLQGVFNRFELVSREEFDLQRNVLQRSREKLETLQKRVEELESQLNAQ